MKTLLDQMACEAGRAAARVLQNHTGEEVPLYELMQLTRVCGDAISGLDTRRAQLGDPTILLAVVPDEEGPVLCETCGEYTKDCCCIQDSQDQLSRTDLPVIQSWVCGLTLMQQAVLLTAVRGPDGTPKYGACKMLIRWFRRCVLLGSFERRALVTPYEPGGGSFTGPSCEDMSLVDEHWYWERSMDEHLNQYLRELDALPHHFQMHFMHAAEIVGYKHPDKRIRVWWLEVYYRLVHDMHVHVETEEELDQRLGDSREGWLNRADPATTN